MAMPLGLRLNNPMNIKHVPGQRWQGQIWPHPGGPLCHFEHPKWSIRAGARLLITYQDARMADDGSKIDTVWEHISRYAPPDPHGDRNPTDNYAKFVAGIMQIGINDTIDVYDTRTMRNMLVGMIHFEQGYNPYSEQEIAAGMILAGIQPPGRDIVALFKPEPKPVHRSPLALGAATGGVAVAGQVVETFWDRLADPSPWQVAILTAMVVAGGMLLYGWWRERQRGAVDQPLPSGPSMYEPAPM